MISSYHNNAQHLRTHEQDTKLIIVMVFLVGKIITCADWSRNNNNNNKKVKIHLGYERYKGLNRNLKL